jgi:hypothetical protein
VPGCGPTQLTTVAARLRETFDEAAKERREETQGRPKKGDEKLPEKLPAVKADSRDQAGAAVGVSGKLVDAATGGLRLAPVS